MIDKYILKVYTQYQKGEHMKQVQHQGLYLKLNVAADKDIIKRLDTVRSEGKNTKQGYIKDLIRTDIALDGLRNSYKEN